MFYCSSAAQIKIPPFGHPRFQESPVLLFPRYYLGLQCIFCVVCGAAVGKQRRRLNPHFFNPYSVFNIKRFGRAVFGSCVGVRRGWGVIDGFCFYRRVRYFYISVGGSYFNVFGCFGENYAFYYFSRFKHECRRCGCLACEPQQQYRAFCELLHILNFAFRVLGFQLKFFRRAVFPA